MNAVTRIVYAIPVVMVSWWGWPYLDSMVDFSSPAPRPADGQLVGTEPIRKSAAGDLTDTHEITGRVLSRKKYPTSGRRLDVVVGWGPMSDNRVLDFLTVNQHDHQHEIALKPAAGITPEQAYATSMNIVFDTRHPGAELDYLRQIRVGDVINVKGYSRHAAEAGEPGCAKEVTGRRCLVLVPTRLQVNERKLFGHWDH